MNTLKSILVCAIIYLVIVILIATGYGFIIGDFNYLHWTVKARSAIVIFPIMIAFVLMMLTVM